jgi:hypothetical protein
MKDPQSDMYRKMMEIAGVKGGYHRDQIFAEDKRSDYLWCLHCHRTYRRGEYRDLDGVQMCPYSDCDGNTVMDGFDWEGIRDHHKKYPQIPERGKIYRD